ncbi:MAG: OstA family protein, partial [Deinococcota bacterium]|nr:OstA family protein [Deinococcota bacterium]
MSKALTMIITLFLLAAVAQETGQTETQETGDQGLERRVITIEASGGTQSGNIRTGPLAYSHPDPEGVVATVSTLTIYAQQATLSAPEGVLLSQARGEREASFVNGVRVVRGRMSATGPELVYSEVTGRGSLAGPTKIVLAPAAEDEDEVEITADEADFDVDADTSTSRGGVTLISGRSSAEAEEIVFEEERELARLQDEGGQVTIVRRDDENGDLTITADEIRVLTGSDRLLARGNVTLTSGNTVSTGETVYFDDESSQAEILG